MAWQSILFVGYIWCIFVHLVMAWQSILFVGHVWCVFVHLVMAWQSILLVGYVWCVFVHLVMSCGSHNGTVGGKSCSSQAMNYCHSLALIEGDESACFHRFSKSVHKVRSAGSPPDLWELLHLYSPSRFLRSISLGYSDLPCLKDGQEDPGGEILSSDPLSGTLFLSLSGIRLYSLLLSRLRLAG